MRLRPTSAAAIALVAAAALTLTGCGSADKPVADAPGTAVTTPADNGTPDPGADPGSSTEPTPAPLPPPTESEGDGDGESDDTPATAGGGICGDLSADEVGAVLGGTVTGAALPGGGCVFTQPSAKAPSASFVEKSLAKSPGGIEGAKTDATSSVEGEPQNLRGIGDAAFVVTGTAFGEPAVQGAGAVQVGKRIISTNLTQSSGMGAAAVKAMTVKLLKLAAAQAG